MSNEDRDLDDDRNRETAWRDLAKSLYIRLAECKRGATFAGNSILPKLPSQDELDAFEVRFKTLSRAGGWTTLRSAANAAVAAALETEQPPRRRRWWWPFS